MCTFVITSDCAFHLVFHVVYMPVRIRHYNLDILLIDIRQSPHRRAFFSSSTIIELLVAHATFK